MPKLTPRYATLIYQILLVAALIGCSGAPATETGSMASEAPTPTAMPTSIPAPTRTPHPTLTPTIAPSPTPDVPLSENGPWLVFMSQDELWAANPNGTGLTQLTNKEHRVIAFSVNPVQQPDGKHEIAYLTTKFGEPTWLHMMDFPYGQTRTVITQISPTDINVMRGLVEWSPNGLYLAFVGAIEGPTLDVYCYEPATGEIRRLTQGPLHAWNLLWSPESRYIVHAANPEFEIGGSVPAASELWSVSVDGSSVVGFEEKGVWYENWLDDETLLLYSGPNIGGSWDLRITNIRTGNVRHLFEGHFQVSAYDSVNNTAFMIFAESADFPAVNEDIPPEGPGLYSLKAGRTTFIAPNLVSVYWSTETGKLYGGDSSQQVYEVEPSGALIPVEAPSFAVPYLSPDGHYVAWGHTPSTYSMVSPIMSLPDSGVWIDLPNSTRIQVATDAECVTWSPDSQHVFFIGDDDMGYIASAPNFAPVSFGIAISRNRWCQQFEWIP